MPAPPRAPTAYILQRADRVVIVAPFDRAFSDELRAIPYRWRSYDAGLHAWTVREPHVDAAVTLALRFFWLEFWRRAE